MRNPLRTKKKDTAFSPFLNKCLDRIFNLPEVKIGKCVRKKNEKAADCSYTI